MCVTDGSSWHGPHKGGEDEHWLLGGYQALQDQRQRARQSDELHQVLPEQLVGALLGEGHIQPPNASGDDQLWSGDIITLGKRGGHYLVQAKRHC